MPVGFNSPARNLFLLGSSGTQVVSNFFESISKASTTDGGFIPDEIRYIDSSKKYALAGSAFDSNSKGFGWLERQDYDLDTGNLTTDYSNRIESTLPNTNLTLRAMELDSNENLIVVGFSGAAPWIAKYSNNGVLDWQSTTNSANVRYLGVTSDSNGNYYACGRTSLSASDTQAFVEKFDSNGNPGWGKSAFMLGRDVVLEKISANSGGHVVAVGYLEDDSADKGYIVKIDTTTGEVLWDRTLERNISGFGEGNPSVGGSDDITPAEVRCTACYIDSRDQIYVVGTIDGNPPVDNGIGEFLIKYSPEGNIIWQRERGTRDYTLLDGAPNMVPFDVKSDGETQQTVVLTVEDFGSFALDDSDIFISKYSKNGDLVFRRRISKGSQAVNLGAACLDADPSFYYIMFRDQQIDGLAGEPDRYTFGKVSTSGNGFGSFQYDDGQDIINYTVVTNAENKIGRLSDGSVTNSVSDLMTYPFTANKLVFDDFATHVSNKKRQMDSADSFEYSGSPAIRIADFQELNLLGDVYSGSGDWLDQSGKGNDGIIPFSGPFVGSGSLNFPGGSTDRLEIANSADFNFGTGAYTIEMFIKTTADAGWLYHENDPNNSGMRLCVGTNGSTGSNDGRIEFNEQVSNNDNSIQGTTQINDGEWHHIAVVRGASGDTTKLYVDGVLDATGSANRNFDSSDTLYIGARGTYGGNEYAGEISNLRVVKGVQVYTGNFTPPSAPLTDLSGTSLLVDGSSITDISSNARTITTVGGITARNPSPTHNAAGYWDFDGTNDTIDLGTTSLIEPSSSFSIEAWCWVDSLTVECTIYEISADGNPGTILLSAGGTSDGNVGGRFLVRNTSGQDLGVRDVINNNTGEWHHYVGVHTNNGIYSNVTLYVDGVGTLAADIIDTTHPFDFTNVGVQHLGLSSGNRYLDGRIGEVRIYPRALTAAQVFQNYNATKSKYINEAPDTAPKIGPGIVYDSNLLLNYDFGNRATYDNVNNLLPYSADIRNSQTNWARAGVDIVSTDLKGPFGERGVVGLVEQTNNGQHTLYDDIPYVYNEGMYTSSCWIKPGTRSYAEIFVNGTGDSGTSTSAARFNFNDGTWTDVGPIAPNAVAFEEGPNGWWFCGLRSVIETTAIPGNPGEYRFHVRPATASTGDYQGDDSAPAIYIIHPQVSEDSDLPRPPSSQLSQTIRYVPTYNGAIQSTTVKNLSSSSYPSTIDGAEFNSAGYFVFDNANNDEIISSQTTVADTGMSGMTLEVWANLSSSTVFGTDGNSWIFGEEGRYRLLYTGTSINWVCATANNGWYTAGTSITPTGLTILDGWHHIVGVYDGTNIRLDLDGTTQQTSTSAISGNVNSAGDPQMSLMGTDAVNVGWGTGSIGQVRIYNRGLTATEVSQNYNATRAKYGV